MNKKQQSTTGKKSEELYEPLKILEEKENGDKKLFLIQWKGYDKSESTWEPEENIKHCSIMLDKWEQTQQKNLQNQLKQVKKVIDKKYSMDGVEYLVKWENIRKPDSWVLRKHLIVQHSEKIKEYERQYGLVQKRRHEEKEYDEEKGIFIGSSDEDNNNSSESESEEEDNDCVEKESKETIKVVNDMNKNQKPKQQPEKKMKVSQTRRIVKAKRQQITESPEDDKIVDYNKLPKHGILGIDRPTSIVNMIIDKSIGDKNDQYFACDLAWKRRPNNRQPLDSRVSRLDIKQQFPLLLIEFYEENMTYEGSVENEKQRKNDTDNDDESDDPDKMPVGYPKPQKKYNPNAIDQKKNVKFRS